MNADGSAQTNVTRRSDTDEFLVDWAAAPDD